MFHRVGCIACDASSHMTFLCPKKYAQNARKLIKRCVMVCKRYYHGETAKPPPVEHQMSAKHTLSVMMMTIGFSCDVSGVCDDILITTTTYLLPLSHNRHSILTKANSQQSRDNRAVPPILSVRCESEQAKCEEAICDIRPKIASLGDSQSHRLAHHITQLAIQTYNVFT